MDKIEELKKLKQLLDDGILNESEYGAMKKAILGGTPQKESLATNHMSSAAADKVEIHEGVLTVKWGGQFALIDMKVQLYVNEDHHSTQSFRKGFSVEIPIITDKLKVRVENKVITGTNSITYEIEEIEQGKDYLLELSYDDLGSRFHKEFNLS
ncbi:MAG: hypothetical protein ACJASM_003202 [Salibacteraceae bacterium]|jgi:hypothetical protein